MGFIFGFFAVALGIILVQVYRDRTKQEANLLKRKSQRSSTKIVRLAALSPEENRQAKFKRSHFGRR